MRIRSADDRQLSCNFTMNRLPDLDRVRCRWRDVNPGLLVENFSTLASYPGPEAVPYKFHLELKVLHQLCETR
ncbi:hypothetical protein Mapa_007090 [Marchantia paleacea]|nr:hypothetical protein Mapa_007090 [Marchantia paleacea]